MTPQEQIRRGEDARLLLENYLFKGAIEEVRTGLIDAMSRSPMGDESTHNRLVIALQLLGQIERSLKTHIETGTLVQIEVNEKIGARLKRVAGF